MSRASPATRPPSRVVCAALLMDDGLIVTGIRHFSPEIREVLRRIYGSGFRAFGKWWVKPYHLRVLEQGFVDQYGVFLSREAAWKIAECEGQIREQVSVAGTLYSENLY